MSVKMTDNRTTELLRDYAFALRRLEYAADKPGSKMTLGEYEAEEKRVTDKYAQAIAVTLGGGKLTAEQVHEAVSGNRNITDKRFYCDWQAIADELNATLGGGECKVVASSTDGLTTDDPRQWFELSCGHAFKLDGLDAPVACPVCGRKVVER